MNLQKAGSVENSVDYEFMRKLAADIRKETIQAMASIGFGHIGGSMSIADVLAVLYGGVMRIDPQNPLWEERDMLVLSKGHCGASLYAALALTGYFPLDDLKTLNRPNTNLPSHCDRLKTKGVDMSTGSLGQGISTAIGIALGNRLKKIDSRTYVIMGDGELQEGQVWEGVQFAAHRGLDNLVLFVDNNLRQLDGRLEDICKPFDLKAKFEAFGFNCLKVRGYDVEEIHGAILGAFKTKNQPTAIILETFKGIGCCFAEEADFNHYMVIDETMAREACCEIDRRLAEGSPLSSAQRGART
jgi:transketolase